MRQKQKEKEKRVERVYCGQPHQRNTVTSKLLLLTTNLCTHYPTSLFHNPPLYPFSWNPSPPSYSVLAVRPFSSFFGIPGHAVSAAESDFLV
ncbi:hypothetical protein VNO78_25228 [Psophocarpus tetragonolobus]|uniref:Uncharacterized protein n=1 Tax=Psophocarpus tetragonolobus TaxID=3891 RepID=A0AAN9S6J1_PSOTE